MKHWKTPATTNRYRSCISLAYRLGMGNGMVQVNPARLVRFRKENNARRRNLSRDEYKKVLEILGRGSPEHVQHFKVSNYA
jgi:hypothetical protein